ncbi:MAG TPA: hypothetical protein VL147_04755, partial [Devosia sp.]|nr:hypothetical protein [Devosia sp.]
MAQAIGSLCVANVAGMANSGLTDREADLIIRHLLLVGVAASFSSAAFANDGPGVVQSAKPFIYFQILGGITAA